MSKNDEFEQLSADDDYFIIEKEKLIFIKDGIEYKLVLQTLPEEKLLINIRNKQENTNYENIYLKRELIELFNGEISYETSLIEILQFIYNKIKIKNASIRKENNEINIKIYIEYNEYTLHIEKINCNSNLSDKKISEEKIKSKEIAEKISKNDTEVYFTTYNKIKDKYKEENGTETTTSNLIDLDENEIINKNFVNIINSQIITSKVLQKKFFEMVKKYCYSRDKKFKFKLYYNSLTDTDSSAAFHKKCDDIVNVIVIYKTKNNEIFGGYTKIGFDSSNKAKIGKFDFLFKLKEGEFIHFGKKINTKSVFCHKLCGPSFGIQDIKVPNNFLSNPSLINDECDSCFDLNEKIVQNYTARNEVYIADIEVYQIL